MQRALWLRMPLFAVPLLVSLYGSGLDGADELSIAAFPLFGTQMYNALGIQWASSLLAFLAVAMIPFPYLFFRYGKQLRSKSRFATG